MHVFRLVAVPCTTLKEKHCFPDCSVDILHEQRKCKEKVIFNMGFGISEFTASNDWMVASNGWEIHVEGSGRGLM